MNVLRIMLKYAGYYILIEGLIAVFAAPPTKGALSALCGAALAVAMFAAVLQLLLDGSIGAAAQRISSWCWRGTVIVTAIVIISGIGIGNIIKVFSGG